MRVVVVGATGNVGTSLVEALVGDDRIEEIVGIARRRPQRRMPKTTWVAADIARDPLIDALRGADACVHLAWAIQPSRDLAALTATNVEGTRRVFQAAGDAGVRALVYASSIGAYSPGPKAYGIDETWPTDGIATAFYSRHKAETERLLDRFETEHPDVRVVRLRPGLTFKREAAAEIRRLFFGPLLPGKLVQPRMIPALPHVEGLRFQAVHSQDVAEAYRLAITTDVSGAFNVAADPILDTDMVAELLGARRVKMPARALRVAATATWRARLQPSPPGWVDMAAAAPIMATDRARDVLGWKPERTSDEALLDLLGGLRDAAGYPTPPLESHATGPFRIREFTTGVGGRAF